MNIRNKSAFRSIKEIATFKVNLEKVLYYDQNRNMHPVEVDVCKLLLLIIYVPVSPKALMKLKKRDCRFDTNSIVVEYEQSTLNQKYERFFSIANPVKAMLISYIRQSGNSEYIFSNLMAMKTNRNKIVSTFMQSFWGHFDIKEDDSRLFLEYFTKKHCYLKSELIAASLKGSVHQPSPNDRRPFEMLLMDWWVYKINDSSNIKNM